MADLPISSGSTPYIPPADTQDSVPPAPVTPDPTLDEQKDAAGTVENPEGQPPVEDLPPAEGTGGAVDVDEPDAPTYESPDYQTPSTTTGTSTLDNSASVPNQTQTQTDSSRREQAMQAATQQYAQAVQSGDAAAAQTALNQVAPIVTQPVDTVEVAKDKAEQEKEKGMKEVRQLMNGEEVVIKQDSQKLKKMESLALRQIQIAKQQKNAKAQGEWTQVLDRLRTMQQGVSERKKGAMAQMARDISTKWDTLKGVKKELVGGEEAKPETAEDKEFKKFFKKMVVAGDFLITTKQEKEQAKLVEEQELGMAEPTDEDVKTDLKEDKAAGKKTKEEIREAKKAQRAAAAEAKKAAGIQHPDAAKLADVTAKFEAHFAKIGRTFGEAAKLTFKGKKTDAKAGSSDDKQVAKSDEDSGFSITGLFAAISGIFQADERESRSGEEQRAAESDVRTSALGAYQYAVGGRINQYAAPQTFGTGRAGTQDTAGVQNDKVSATGPDAVANLKTVETNGKAAPFVDSVAANKAQHSAQYWNVDHWRGNEQDSEYQLSHTQSTHGLPNNRA